MGLLIRFSDLTWERFYFIRDNSRQKYQSRGVNNKHCWDKTLRDIFWAGECFWSSFKNSLYLIGVLS